MSKKIRYTDEEISEARVIYDFLPSPQELAQKNKQTKITLALSDESLTFFKEAATKLNTPYQKMIRQLLDEYVAQQKRMNP